MSTIIKCITKVYDSYSYNWYEDNIFRKTFSEIRDKSNRVVCYL